jgi:hypothetical protein
MGKEIQIMKMYVAGEDEDFIESMIKMLEQDTGKNIFTMRILEHSLEGLETLIVFEDKEVMFGIIRVISVDGQIAFRMQGNFV